MLAGLRAYERSGSRRVPRSTASRSARGQCATWSSFSITAAGQPRKFAGFPFQPLTEVRSTNTTTTYGGSNGASTRCCWSVRTVGHARRGGLRGSRVPCRRPPGWWHLFGARCRGRRDRTGEGHNDGSAQHRRARDRDHVRHGRMRGNGPRERRRHERRRRARTSCVGGRDAPRRHRRQRAPVRKVGTGMLHRQRMRRLEPRVHRRNLSAVWSKRRTVLHRKHLRREPRVRRRNVSAVWVRGPGVLDVRGRGAVVLRHFVQCRQRLHRERRSVRMPGLWTARPTLLHDHARVRRHGAQLLLPRCAPVLHEQRRRHAGPARRQLHHDVRRRGRHVHLERDGLVLHRVRRPGQSVLRHDVRPGSAVLRGQLPVAHGPRMSILPATRSVAHCAIVVLPSLVIA